MSYKNRNLMRDPLCMIRTNQEEREKLLRLADRLCSGGAPAVTLREALLRLADECEEQEVDGRFHGGNPSQGKRVDRGFWNGLQAA
jgi:hypothetical protein